ncbi:MAG TPA: hypothetical protein ENK02_03810 [Planctomycetes bacterium]|nr:hypothetical protein [Planctomycetota bacterium]
MNESNKGMALIAVLIVLAVLTALVGPFLYSMGQESRAAEDEASAREVRLLTEGARDLLLGTVGASQGTLDPSPGYDGLSELPSKIPIPKDQDGNSFLGANRVVSGGVEDLQARIHAPTAPLQVWGNLLGLWGTLSEDLTAEEIKVLPVDQPSRFDDEGYVWIDNELFHYRRRTNEGLEDVERAFRYVDSGNETGKDKKGAEPVADPYGPAVKHKKGAMVVDARLRLLLTYQFDEGGGARKRFTPWKDLGSLARVSDLELGELSAQRLEPLRSLLCFDGARPEGHALGRAVRIFNPLIPGETQDLVVKDPASFPMGAMVRVSIGDQVEWAMVVRHQPGGRGWTSVKAGSLWSIRLDRPVRLEAAEGEAFVAPLLPTPINLNTASREVLVAILTGVRSRPGVDPHGGSVIRDPISKTTAGGIADRILAEREENEEHGPKPFTGFEDLFARVLKPISQAQELSNPQLFALYAQMVNGRQARLATAGIPVCFESSGLVSYRVAGAIRSGIGRTLAEREIVGRAFAQPGRGVDRVYASQRDLDEAGRLDRGRPYWRTDPINTTMRLGAASGEPPDLSLPHLMPFLHGLEARFPSRSNEEGRALLAIARAPRFVGLNPGWSFETDSNPEGRDLRREGPFEAKVLVPQTKNGLPGFAKKVKASLRRNNRSPFIPILLGKQGLGSTFALSAWYKPKTLGEGVLFDLSSTDPLRNRYLLAMDSQELTFRLFDNAGADPDPNPTSPSINALTWTVPLSQSPIEAGTWFHAAFQVASGRPTGLSLFVDGAPMGKASFVGFLQGQMPKLDLGPLFQSARVPGGRGVPKDVLVPGLVQGITGVDLDSFPSEGVVRIGNELVEYTNRGSNNLGLARRDSRGGRNARVSLGERFYWALTKNAGSGGPGQGGSPGNPGAPGSPIKVEIDEHPDGATVEFYGYSNPLVEGTILPPGEGRLSGSLAPWGVARVTTARDTISLNAGRVSRQLGKGISETYTGTLDLAAPVLGKANNAQVPGFDPGGGYALLIQVGITLQDNRTSQETFIGGIELVKYSSATKTSITLSQRGIRRLPPDLNPLARGGLFSGVASQFVTKWDKGVFGRGNSSGPDPNQDPRLWTYCVPISLRVNGLKLVDPSKQGHSEWVQVYPKGRDEWTEWVRYDYVEGNLLVRSRRSAVLRLGSLLTGRTSTLLVQGDARNMTIPLPGRLPNLVKPPISGRKEIGEPDVAEAALSYAARRVFAFRGDPFTGTSTHTQGAGSIVTPVFRTVLGTTLQESLDLGRPGRGDRVALVSTAGNPPAPPEWHTVQWAARLPVFDNRSLIPGRKRTRNGGRRNQARNSRGRRQARSGVLGFAANLVALREGAGTILFGQKFQEDTRLLDRIVKFPSGELPMRLQDRARFGASNQKDFADFQGLLDDVQSYTGFQPVLLGNGGPGTWLGRLQTPCSPSDTQLQGYPMRRSPSGISLGASRTGLLWIGGELLGMKSLDRSTGKIEIAARGLLGTEARAHDRGEPIYFVACRPATVLASNMSAQVNGVYVAEPDNLPQVQGTLLIDRELLHYTWQRAGLLEMPSRYESLTDTNQNQGSSQGTGLFRGRYGTIPSNHQNGAVAIYWPIRYWDRYADRAEDPELASFNFGMEAPDVFLSEVYWEEEIADSHLDLELLVRADERVPFSADPERSPFLWRFRDPKGKSKQGRLFIGAQASRWDFRFGVRYLTGAFDPVQFLGTGWKKTPVLKTFGWSYHAPTRILFEEERLR